MVAVFCALVAAVLAVAVARCSWEEVVVRAGFSGVAGGILAWSCFSCGAVLRRRGSHSRLRAAQITLPVKELIDEIKQETADQEISPDDAARAISRMMH